MVLATSGRRAQFGHMRVVIPRKNLFGFKRRVACGARALIFVFCHEREWVEDRFGDAGLPDSYNEVGPTDILPAPPASQPHRLVLCYNRCAPALFCPIPDHFLHPLHRMKESVSTCVLDHVVLSHYASLTLVLLSLFLSQFGN